MLKITALMMAFFVIGSAQAENYPCSTIYCDNAICGQWGDHNSSVVQLACNDIHVLQPNEVIDRADGEEKGIQLGRALRRKPLSFNKSLSEVEESEPAAIWTNSEDCVANGWYWTGSTGTTGLETGVCKPYVTIQNIVE